MSEKIPITVDPDLEDLIPGFLQNRHNDVSKLTALLAEKSYTEIHLLGHSMKGVGGGYGFDAITEFGAEIERAAEAEDDKLIRDYTERLADYLSRIEVVYEA